MDRSRSSKRFIQYGSSSTFAQQLWSLARRESYDDDATKNILSCLLTGGSLGQNSGTEAESFAADCGLSPESMLEESFHSTNDAEELDKMLDEEFDLLSESDSYDGPLFDMIDEQAPFGSLQYEHGGSGEEEIVSD